MLEQDFLSIKNKLEPKQGRFLISDPFSKDSFFSRAVVLLTSYSKEGSTGFILNKPIDAKISDLITEFDNFEANLSLGGPVSTDSIFFIHKLGNIIPDSHHIFDKFYWGGDIKVIRKKIKGFEIHPNQMRFFIGYSGWSSQQLEEELKNNYWIVVDKVPQNFMTNFNPNMWNKLLLSLGERFSVWANLPKSPNLN